LGTLELDISRFVTPIVQYEKPIQPGKKEFLIDLPSLTSSLKETSK